MQNMRALTESYGERVLIGELYLPIESLMSYYGQQLDEILSIVAIPFVLLCSGIAVPMSCYTYGTICTTLVTLEQSC